MFAYCRSEPVFRKDVHGTEDVCVTNADDDNNPLNDLGKSPSGGGGGKGKSGGSSSNKKPCFIAETSIATEIGAVAIETIKVGDYVWATNPESGETELKQVVQTFVNEATEHPFYSPVKGWTAACKLRAGDILVMLNGEYVVVEQVQHELLETPVTVYNFEVEGFHTYYVGDTGILVHNSCNHNSKWNSERRRFWKKQAQTAEIDKNYGSYTATIENINRMKKGKAPIGWDGYSVTLHHWKGIANDFYDYSPLSRTLHQMLHKYLK